MHETVWQENMKERDHCEDIVADGIKMDLRELRHEGLDWIQLAKGIDWCLTLPNAATNLRCS
jgi:hypothetical protein